jgi:organic hydroperoxide reductase OsmC/OhrA
VGSNPTPSASTPRSARIITCSRPASASASSPTAASGLTVELDVHVPNLDQPAAEALVADAHKVCPYSNATRGNVDVALTVV